MGQTESVSDAYLWTVPALKQAKTMKQLNTSLRAENKALKKEVSSMKKKLGKLAHWSKGKFAFQVLINFGFHHFEPF
jgi:hypothetical protein